MGASTAHRAQPRTDRLSHLDNLKALLVAWIIFGHALLGYVAYGGWSTPRCGR